MTVTGELRDWEYDHMYNVYFGNIFCDRKRRWIDGKRIRTSSVLAVEDGEDHFLVVTLNSTYRLNKNQQMGKTHETSQSKPTPYETRSRDWAVGERTLPSMDADS